MKAIAECLGKSNIKHSRCWLQKWKKRYNVKHLKVNGESADVQGETVDSWKKRLPEIVNGYAKDIWNTNKTGMFWQDLPDRGYGQKGKECYGNKKSKTRVTVAFCVSAAGTKENSILICKSEKSKVLTEV